MLSAFGSKMVPRMARTSRSMMQVRNMGGSASYHIDTPDNLETTPFDFTEENYKRVDMVLSKYPANYKQSGIIPLLDLAQRQHGGWLPLSAMNKVAEVVECAPARVYEVASFYTMFNRTKRGKYFIQLCGTTPCMICGSEDISKTITKHLGIKSGETTKDGLFTLLEVECLGACANAPMIQLNDDYFECLTPKTMIEILELCKAGTPPEMGKWGSLPMNGQVSCEGPLGKTSLFKVIVDDEVNTTVREGGFNGEVDPASVKNHMGY